MELTPVATPVVSSAPVAETERIFLIDSLRGIAILGILLMNIPGFGLPYIASYDLSILNEFSGPNFMTWLFIEALPEGSMRALFSMLFGAGMILFVSRLQKKHEGLLPADLYFRRQMWLLFFGLLNTYLFLWFWDILFMYAVCGMLLFVFRNLPVKTLLLAAGICLLLATAREQRDLYEAKADIRLGEQIALMDTTQTKLTPLQQAQLSTMQEIKERSTPESKKKRYDMQLLKGRGTLAQVYDQNSNIGAEGHTTVLYYFFIWDILLFMFLGMAFFKSGVLTGKASNKTYWAMMLIGLIAGGLLSYLRLSQLLHFRFNSFERMKATSFELYELSRCFRAIGIFGAIMLLYKWGGLKGFFRLMQPVGQMAFSNYLMQSIICGLLFFGVGFGLYGQLQRYQLYFVVGGVWLFQIVFSHIWLRYFRFGPFEWLWRSLTYWKIQPFKRSPPQPTMPDALATA